MVQGLRTSISGTKGVALSNLSLIDLKIVLVVDRRMALQRSTIDSSFSDSRFRGAQVNRMP